MNAPLLEMRGIRKSFPGVVALDGVDLTLHAGAVHMLLGENGAGKSTLIRILGGAQAMDGGQVRLQGTPVAIDGPAAANALGIRVIHQELTLVPHLTVAENVFLGTLPTNAFRLVDWRRLRTDTIRLLTELGDDAAAIDPMTRAGTLGLAHRQLVEIAKALAPGGVRVLVMDEPTSSLSSREVDRLFALVERLASSGTAIVYITHRLDEVFRIGHHVTVLRDGRVVSTGAIRDVTAPELVRVMANRELADHYPRVRPPAGRELLRADQLSRRGVVHGATFTLHAGEVLGIAGLVGAGRTALARLLAGADRSDGGRLFVEGRDVTLRSPADAIANGIGLLPEDRRAEGLVPAASLIRNIALPQARRLSHLGIVDGPAERTTAARAVSELRIKGQPTGPVRLLSGGNQQKVVLGKWLASGVRVFIFDEPTRGIDIAAKVEIYGLINRLTADGAGVIMISSELPELLGMSDRILVMRRGRICDDMSADEATEERVLGSAFGLDGDGDARPRGMGTPA